MPLQDDLRQHLAQVAGFPHRGCVSPPEVPADTQRGVHLRQKQAVRQESQDGVRTGGLSACQAARPGVAHTEGVEGLQAEEEVPEDEARPDGHRVGLEELEGEYF